MNLALFHAKIAKGAPDECWEWQGGRDGRGYGLWGVTKRGPDGYRRTYVASRLAYEQSSGRSIPAGMCALHTCDNPPCCNPAHLFVGTPLDNARDKMAKGRLRHGDLFGEDASHAKLTWAQVDEIRARPNDRGVDLAVEFNISQQVICNIRKWRTWNRERPAA